MTVFADEKKIIRRFLRDPEGNIWSDNDILTYWNDTQMEIASKIGFIEKANTYPYPPEWTWAYLWDWEYQYIDGDRYRCLLEWQAENMIGCYPWEGGYFLDNSDTPDDGYRFTHPWEGIQIDSPADVVPVPFPERLSNIKFLSYDEEQLSNLDRKEIALSDSSYRTVSGSAQYYYRPDSEGNQFVPYPRPSNVTWPDSELDEIVDDAGGIVSWSEAALDETDRGVITDSIDTEDAFFAVFESIPENVSSDPGDWSTEEIDFPSFMTKYIRYGTLERCFGADTDGFIPSLRDFWQQRKELGINAIKRFKNMRCQDRDYRLGGGTKTSRPRHGRLPAEYPSI